MSSPPGAAPPRSEPGTPPTRTRATARAEPGGRRLAALSLTALGVVFGDIGTSPLYAFREAFNPAHGLAITPAVVYGVLSMIG